MQLNEIIQKAHERQHAWDANEGAQIAKSERLVDEARTQVERARKRLTTREARMSKLQRNLIRPDVRGDALNEMMLALAPYFPGLTPEVLGPFGISCAYSLRFNHPTDESQTKTLTVMVDEGAALSWRDYSRYTGEWKKGSIGDMDGLNYPSVPISPEATLEEIAALFM